MEPGDVVGDRFLIEALAGRGGMGSVYRAVDRVTGELVALKVLAGGPALYEERFLRESKALAAVSHPAIVRYVAQGTTGPSSWLAMEWLQGEDLADCLQRRGRLDLPSALAMAARCADGIAAAHELGIVHRDLKPSNLFLVGRDPRALKLIDFGVARTNERARPLTKTGQMIGTVGFMAPEQITGERDLDHRADLFALGCVVFECVTGQPAFPGTTSIAIIAKVLREDPARPSELEPTVPRDLDGLLLSMLSKARGDRPSSAREVAERLRGIAHAIADQPTIAVPVPAPSRPSVSAREQFLVSVVLLVPRQPDAHVGAIAREVVRSHGADAVDLGEGAFLFILGRAGTAKDQAARAASCALALRGKLPSAKIAIGTGLAEPTGALPVGPAIDRAAALIEIDAGTDIPIDDVSAALLGDAFQIGAFRTPAGAGTVPVLVGRGGEAKAVREVPFVGRDKELAIIDAVATEAFDEAVPRSVVVTGAPGSGKSRLRREFLSRVATRAASGDALPTVAIARADVVGAGSALALARQIVERLVGVTDTDSVDTKTAALGASVGHIADAASRAQTRELLAELLGLPAAEPPSAELRALREEPRVFAECLKRAFVDVVCSAAQRAPLVLVLEDLHWGDEASVDFVAAALEANGGGAQRLGGGGPSTRQEVRAELPLLVVALARPEVWDVLPRLDATLAPQKIHLGGLTPRAAQRLAEAALGPGASKELVARIVQRSEGNPFFLEELARSAAEGQVDTSETVLAIVQTRIQRLVPEARRVLRAASVFGRACTMDGVCALLDESASGLDDIVSFLEDRDIVTRDHAQRTSFSFKHDLLRDAAYATLPEAERRDAHRLAAEFLQGIGADDAAVLADHYERAHETQRTIEWLARAIAEAQNAGANARVVVLAERAIRAGATGELRGTIRGAEALSFAWQHDWARARAATSDALESLPRGSVPWFRAVAVHAFACVSLGDPEAISELTRSVTELSSEPDATAPYAFGVLVLILISSLSGHRSASEELIRRLDARGEGPGMDRGFVAWRAIAKAHVALSIHGRPGDALRHLEGAASYVPSVPDSVARGLFAFFMATAIFDAGDVESAGRMAAALVDAPGLDAVPYLRTWTKHVVGRTLLGRGKLEEVVSLTQSLLSNEDALFAQRALSLHAQALVALDRLDEADAVAATVVAGTFAPQDVAIALAVAARVKLKRGDPEAARASIARAVALVAEYGGSSTSASFIHLTHAQVLFVASGSNPADIDEARDAIRAARERVHEIGEGIDDAALRHAWFTTRDNARMLRLAESVLGPHELDTQTMS